MNRQQFLRDLDELLGLPTGTLKGDEQLDELANWDSTALISAVAMIDSVRGTRVSPREIVGCSSITDLLRLAHLESQ